MLLKLSNLNSNLALTLGYLNPALNNSAQINLSPVNNAIGLPKTHIHWRVIYPVDSAIQLKNNWSVEI